MPLEASLIVLQAKNILSQNQATQIQVGYIDQNGFLFNITSSLNLNIEVVQGVADFPVIDGNLCIIPYSLETLILKITYNNIFNYFSLWIIPEAQYPQIPDLTNVIYKYLWPNCYNPFPNSTAYSKNEATANVFANIYSFIDQNFLTLYPPFTTDTAWEQELNNNVPWANSSHYNLVIQEINNLSTFNANLYNVTFLIAEYIYARIGEALFVYVEQTYSNPDNSWVMGYSKLGINTILAVPSVNNNIIVHIQTNALPPGFETELTTFILKILPPDVTVTIELDISFAIFGLIINIQDTYNEDPRLVTPYALSYDTATVYNASALISPYNPLFITAYYISPPSGPVSPTPTEFPVTATAVYTYNSINYPRDVTNLSTFTSSNTSVIVMEGNIADIVGLGITEVTGNFLGYGKIWQGSAYYSVQTTVWDIGFSALDSTTTLG